MKKSILIAGLFMLVCGSSALSFARGTSANTAKIQSTIMNDTVVPVDTTVIPVDTTKVPTKAFVN